MFSGFHKKTVQERRADLSGRGLLDAKDFSPGGGLTVEQATLMVENAVGVLGLPVGVCPTLVVNGKSRIVPMAVEEPSIIAACTGAAKLVAKHGGFHAQMSARPLMTAQVQLTGVSDLAAAVGAIKEKETELVSYANETLCASMFKRGGGCVAIGPIREIQPRPLTTPGGGGKDRAPYLVVHIQVDVCEAMGANVVNTVAEGLSGKLAALVPGGAAQTGFRILTNLCDQRTVKANFEIPVEGLAWKGVSGAEVAGKILDGFHFAWDDPYRAATHNKGVMNGIDAAAVALGQDWRALEAGAHAFASRDGTYSPLTRFWVVDGVFHGEIEFPCSVGTKGGALGAHLGFRAAHRILGNPSANELAEILAAIGLAQNFAAIRALAVTGIQQGHMKLHARNVALAAGCPADWVGRVAGFMAPPGRKPAVHASVARILAEAISARPPESAKLPPEDWSLVLLSADVALCFVAESNPRDFQRATECGPLLEALGSFPPDPTQFLEGLTELTPKHTIRAIYERVAVNDPKGAVARALSFRLSPGDQSKI